MHDLFLSVVLVVRNQKGELKERLTHATEVLSGLVSDYELIVVDNASTDSTFAELEELTGEDGLPNLQVYALTRAVDNHTAGWVGVENALGDISCVLDPLTDDIDFIPTMLEKAVEGADVVFATNETPPRRSLAYRAGLWAFTSLYKRFNGIDLVKEAPHFRMMNRKVINFVLQHPQPSATYRHLPATGGFKRERLTYRAPPDPRTKKRLGDSVDRGMRLLVSTTRGPMRLVTGLSLFGAVSNVLYSFYVIAIAVFKEDVAPGWVTLSLQQSGMFFLISLVLLVLGEYLIQVATLSNEGPPYHVARELTSARLTRREKLNVETVDDGQRAESKVRRA